MEQRAGCQRRPAHIHRLAREAHELAGADHEGAAQVGEEVAVGLDRAPGPAGGARREQDGCRIVDGHLDIGQGCVPVGVDQTVDRIRLVGSHTDHGYPGIAVEALQAATVGDEHLGIGQLDAVADLVALPPAVHGHRDGSGADRSPESLDPTRLVGAQQPHPVAGPDAVALGEPGGDRGGLGDVLGEGGAATVVEEVVAGGSVAAVVGRRGQQVSQAVVRAGHHAHVDAVHRLGDDLEEAAGAGEHGVGLGDRHGRLLGSLGCVSVLVSHRRDTIGAAALHLRPTAAARVADSGVASRRRFCRRARGHHRRRSSGARLHRPPPRPLCGAPAAVPGGVQPALRRVLDGHRLRVGGGRGPRQRDLRPQVRARLRRRDLLPRHLRHTPAAVRAPHGGVGDRRSRARRSSPGAQPLHDHPGHRATAAPHGGRVGVVPRPGRRGWRGGPGARLRHPGPGGADLGADGHGVVQLEALRRLLPRHGVV